MFEETDEATVAEVAVAPDALEQEFPMVYAVGKWSVLNANARRACGLRAFSLAGFSLSRAARAPPAEPAPTMM